MATVIFEEQLEIPTIRDLAEFRRWALSESFPETGRIDFIAGRIEVDMSPEDLFTHGTLKSKVAGVIEQRIASLDIGHTFIDSTRISSIAGDLSCEPDVVVICYESIDNGQVSFVSKASGAEGRYVEVEGAPDLIVEIVSDSSVTKDTRRLPEAYHRAGVKEFWLIDARKEELVFQVHRNEASGFANVQQDNEGFQQSAVLQCPVRIDRERHQRGHWVYRLRMK